jgi:hypothetical protein
VQQVAACSEHPGQTFGTENVVKVASLSTCHTITGPEYSDALIGLPSVIGMRSMNRIIGGQEVESI